MNNLEAVVKRAKRDIELKYVYVMMPIPQLQTLLDGLEELQRENEQLRHRDKIIGLANDTLGRYVREGKEEISRLRNEVEEKDDAISYAMNQIQIKESHIRKMEDSSHETS